MELGGLIVGYIWLGILFIVLVGLNYCSVKFLLQTKKMKADAIKALQRNEKKLQDKYNQIASLPPVELDRYLSNMFAKCLELNSAAYVSDNDHEAREKLYARATADMLAYLGTETIDAINYRYGTDYIYRWCEINYKLLENRGTLVSIINKTTYAETIANGLTGMAQRNQ